MAQASREPYIGQGAGPVQMWMVWYFPHLQRDSTGNSYRCLGVTLVSGYNSRLSLYP